METIEELEELITHCRKCPRLVEWRERVAREKQARFRDWEYWGRPVPGFGDPAARLVIVGLAPAAHGGNRTGRIFTGDRSGDWLFRTLHKFGFANQPASVSREDGLKLTDCFVTAAVRCTPPANMPAAGEFANCRPYLARELELLERARVLVGLGRVGFESAWKAAVSARKVADSRKPKFGHGAEAMIGEGLTLLGSFHPSQQNTFTGKMTEVMFDSVFRRARRILGG
ncbi:uracil-DNA glycosylase [bacterium]|nr:uracil-DNA glycosylase [bacterium]